MGARQQPDLPRVIAAQEPIDREDDQKKNDEAELDEQHQKKIRESVDSLLGAVSEADRILLMLKEVEGLSLKELEKIYKVNENALKVRLFRARQRVLKAFGAGEKGK